MSARGFEIADRLLALAAHAGADATVWVRESREGNVRFAAGEVTTAGESASVDTTLELAFGQRHASATTNQIDDASLRALADRAATLARVAPKDPEHLPPLGPQRYVRNPRAWDEATSALDPAWRASAARAAIARAEEKSLVAAGFIEVGATESTLSTSAGLRAEHRGTRARMTTTARTSDGKGSGWAGADATRVSEIDAGALAQVAADRADRSRAATKLDPGRYTVVLEPAAVADLLSFLLGELDARAADQGRSFFSRPSGRNRIGEPIFDPRVVLRSDPLDPATPGCPWDGDGLPLAPTTWLDRGVLRQLYYTRFWAKRSGRAPTGTHGVYTLSSAGPAASSAAELVAGVHRGLLVTRFWYTRWLDEKRLVATGLTRDGVFLIEDGRIGRPVNNFRFNDSPVKMLSRLVGMTQQSFRAPVGDAVVRVPIVACDDFEMSSVSDAV
ncbi:MAG TPA: TldD/PmbA family protein [Polyangiaceae bacterium]